MVSGGVSDQSRLAHCWMPVECEWAELSGWACTGGRKRLVILYCMQFVYTGTDCRH